MQKGEVIIYQTKEGTTSIDVTLENETVWLSQQQIAVLFGTKRPAITKHLKNIFLTQELDENSVCSKMEHTAADGKTYSTKFYSLDAILSVGYRINSRNATQFRIWANKVLKDYLVKGYAINQKASMTQLEDLKRTVKLLSHVMENKELSADEAQGLLRVITDYAYGLDTLDKYDYQKLEIEATTREETFHATYEKAMEAIYSLQKKFGGSALFANEKDQSFCSSISTIYQTFDGDELYPSIEEKAAVLFYLVVKNHSFSDGNKRIAAFLFLWFMEKNGILYKNDGSLLIGNNTLVALTLMIAENHPEEKDIMIKVVINLINRNN